MLVGQNVKIKKIKIYNTDTLMQRSESIKTVLFSSYKTCSKN